jgi:outer membrane receptor protein involved in Fe transport
LAWGPGAVESPLADWGLDARYSLAWRKGNHYFKFGLSSMRNINVGYLYVPQGVGSSSFDGFATGQVVRNAAGAITGATQGDPFADFLLGASSAFSGNPLGGEGFGAGGGQSNFNQSQYAAFVQDEWKFSKNLSLSVGLRWEQPRPPYYEGNRTGTFKQDFMYCAIDYSKGRWNPTQTFPEGFDIQKWAGGDLTKTSIPYANLDRRGCYEARWTHFMPRLGLAWKMFGTNRTVLRVGAGSSNDTMIGVSRSRPLITTIGAVNTVQTRGAAPAVSFGKFKDLPTLAASAEYSTDYHTELDWREGTVYSYNLSIQHELFNGTMLEVAYVGNQGRHLKTTMVQNMAMPEGYDRIVLQNGERLTASSAPVTLPGTNIVFSGQKARRPYPQIIANVMYRPDGNTHYDSLQAKVERRFSSGWALSSGYTWSKAMALNHNGVVTTNFDPVSGTRVFERNLLSGVQQQDRPHTFYSSMIWELPFFRNSNGLARTILGGWEVANIVTLASGQTFPVSVGIDVLDLGSRGNSFPDRIADGTLPKSERTVDRFFDTKAFACANPGCPVVVAKASYYGAGNSFPRPLRSAAVPLVDFSMHKKFQIKEKQSFDFRVDMFNSFNHPVFQLPNGSMATANAGRVTDTASPRQIMFGFRFSF